MNRNNCNFGVPPITLAKYAKCLLRFSEALRKNFFSMKCHRSRLLHDWTHRDSITSLVAKMRICCFGSPTIFMVTNVRKCQTERVNIFWIYFAFILNSGSFFFLFTKFFQNKTKEKATRTQNKFQIYQIIQFGIFLHLWL